MENENKFDQQIARLIYHKTLSIMKYTLNLEEQKYTEHGRDDSRFKFFKKELMRKTFETLYELFDELYHLKISEKSMIDEDLKNGYQPTESGGSGYVNTKSFNQWLQKNNKGN